jgi:transcriptional regulator with XRE-family HTH domain
MQTEPAIDMYDFSILRELRKREGLSIADMSQRSGVSTAVISKLERNRTLASLDTLYRLSRVFDLHPSDLLNLAEARSAHRSEASRHTSNGFVFQEIRYGNACCLYGTATGGSRLSRPEIHGDDYEICWVLSGRLRFELPNETHDLGAGQAIQFDAVLSHRYEAVEDSVFILIRLQKNKRF